MFITLWFYNASDLQWMLVISSNIFLHVSCLKCGWSSLKPGEFTYMLIPSIQCEYRGIRFYIDCSLCSFHTFTIILIHINFQCQSLMKVSCTFAKTNRVFKTFGQRFSNRSLFHHMVLAILTVFVLKNSWKWASQAAFLARSFLTNHD